MKRIILVIEGRPRSKRKDYNAYGWRPVETALRNVQNKLKLHRESQPEWEFRKRMYVPRDSNE